MAQVYDEATICTGCTAGGVAATGSCYFDVVTGTEEDGVGYVGGGGGKYYETLSWS